MYLKLLLLMVWTVTSCMASEGMWNYDRVDSKHGPQTWGEHYRACSDKRNSPINIVQDNANLERARCWRLNGWNQPAGWSVLDLHHTVKFSLLSRFHMKTAGAHLGSVFKLLQFHFHWGSHNGHGSEHELEGQSYPLEVHFVHINSRYKTGAKAMASGARDALAVLGFFFKIQHRDNQDMNGILKAIKLDRKRKDGKIAEYRLGPLDNLVKRSMKASYYRYYGSLTTPPCTEIVEWTMFKKPIGISERQMAEFRHQAPTEGTEFYRDVQPIGSRIVTYYE